ncbi:MAG TPA: M48 family metalloprotease [Phnomibacter sp.]|nr:M48 family metalloprotease [Phnomibacter sp.]
MKLIRIFSFAVLLQACLFFVIKANGQDGTPTFACYFSPNIGGEQLCEDYKALSFQDDPEVYEILSRIVGEVGLRPHFQLVPCDSINNCVATIGKNGMRVILYDRLFLKKLTSKNNDNWASLGIFAHEVLHHLNTHTHLAGNASLAQRRELELEADRWSGRILASLGATLEQARSAVSSLPPYEFNPLTSSHPAIEDRLDAIESGYYEGVSLGAKTQKNRIPAEDLVMKDHQFVTLHSLDEINTYQDSNWKVSEIYFLNNSWYAFFVKADSTGANVVFEAEKLEDLIKKISDQKAWINSLNYLNGRWIAIQKKDAPRVQQNFRVGSSPRFTRDEVNDRRSFGFIVRDVAFANGQWVFVEEPSETAKVADQFVFSSRKFPDFEISEWARRGMFRVTSCKFVNNLWILVMHKYQKDVMANTQVRRWLSTFPFADFIEREKDGFRLETASFDGTVWGYIMTKPYNFTYGDVK